MFLSSENDPTLRQGHMNTYGTNSLRHHKFGKITFCTCFFLFSLITSHSTTLLPDTNQLGKSANPALQMYATSPVMWHEWSEKILLEAQEQNKLVFISIGFASCHWCHVMERETFSDSTLAKYLNDHFVCIRVDKEERPEIDRIYQEYAAFTDQNSGWPMNVIAVPNGTPVYSKTYARPDELLSQLKSFHELNRNHNHDFINYAKAVEGLINSSQKPIGDEHFGYPNLDTLNSSLDWQEGGALQSYKFPLSPLLNFTLSSSDSLLNQHALLSINKILSGGIYDHVGGGIHRYTTDELWRFPHWEKTLSDNAQFISNLCAAFSKTKNERYRVKAIETAQFILDNLKLDNGLYANSLDAESSGKEGSYYVWSYSDLQNLLDSRFEEFKRVFAISKEGNYSPDENVLYLSKMVNPDVYDPHPSIIQCLQILRRERQKRVSPKLDAKATVAYNAMFAQACLDLYVVSENEDYLYFAHQIIEKIQSYSDNTSLLLPHSIVDKTTLSDGILEDYAQYIKSLISLYEHHRDEKFLIRAKQYLEYVCLNFTYDQSIWFQDTNNHMDHLFHLIEKSDDDTPSSNALMAENLYILGRYFYNEKWMNRSIDLSLNMAEITSQYPLTHASWNYFESIIQGAECDMVFCGERAIGLALEFKRNYSDFATISYANAETQIPLAQNKFSEKENLIYVCMDRTCQRPVKTVEEALSQIESLQRK